MILLFTLLKATLAYRIVIGGMLILMAICLLFFFIMGLSIESDLRNLENKIDEEIKKKREEILKK